jgi:hypothetical protein
MAAYSITQQGLESLGIKPYSRKKDEEYMNANQIEHFKKILLALKNAL